MIRLRIISILSSSAPLFARRACLELAEVILHFSSDSLAFTFEEEKRNPSIHLKPLLQIGMHYGG